MSESSTLGQQDKGELPPHRERHLDPTIEQELIAELQRGSDRALAAVYQEFNQGVFAYCMKILADRQLAEDVVQETFLKVREHAQSIQRIESFRSWVFRIARNEALMQLRKRRSNGQIEDESVWSEETPHQQFVALERSEIVNRLLDSLKHEYREVLVLLVYENMSYAEIASVTGATESSVKSRIFRARKEMIEKLKPYGEQ
ncbi:MAG: RNA polymerase sigma factor [Ignavibacteria bacterium]|nr:RNA polymerase sigma factor [Ignavibacteria bacterium]